MSYLSSNDLQVSIEFKNIALIIKDIFDYTPNFTVTRERSFSYFHAYEIYPKNCYETRPSKQFGTITNT